MILQCQMYTDKVIMSNLYLLTHLCQEGDIDVLSFVALEIIQVCLLPCFSHLVITFFKMVVHGEDNDQGGGILVVVQTSFRVFYRNKQVYHIVIE